jgi:hypothetical protein
MSKDFQYKDHVQRIRSSVWTFKFEIRTRTTENFMFHEVP